jgi:hypothetical protein
MNTNHYEQAKLIIDQRLQEVAYDARLRAAHSKRPNRLAASVRRQDSH